MAISKEVLAAVIGAVPVVAAPLVGWLLEHRGDSQRSKKLESLDKRAQLVERLLALDKHLTDERRQMLEAELVYIEHDLVADRVREHAAGTTMVERLSVLRRFLLLYDQPTRKASIYRGFFWAFLFCGFLGAGSALLTLANAKPEEPHWPTAIFVLLFYSGIGLICRAAARQQLKRAQAAAARSQKGG
ncbi:MAG TPA: hypothetical protein VLW52_01605 [Opitutaceae bacterium]|nr:hypothetical protein [Opitutaceae bacterium]